MFRSLRPNPAELFVFSLIFAAALLDFAVYCGVVRDDAVGPALSSEARISRREAALRAENDNSPGLPGTFVPNQGRAHTPDWPLRDDQRVPFCAPGSVSDGCYASNPPTSGLHLPVTRDAIVGSRRITLPPDPGVYDVMVPREAVPHIQEHAGIFAGYNCVSSACDAAVEDLRGVVLQELALGARVVLSPDSDLDDDTIALASWTRIDAFAASDYEAARVRTFIKTHSCRFDPEGFCAERAVN